MWATREGASLLIRDPITSSPVTKLSLVKAALAAGDVRKALAIAAKFPRLGDHKVRIERGHAAAVNPDFYREIGKDPEALIADGATVLREILGL